MVISNAQDNLERRKFMHEIDPLKTNRATSYKLYINAPMPMVTIFKTLDITKLIQLKEKGYKLNMLLCYCILSAAQKTKEFYLLPIDHKMFQYDQLGISILVKNKKQELNSCDVSYNDNLDAFNSDYLQRVQQVKETCKDLELPDHMIIGTSSLIHHEIDGVINMYSGIFNNPFLIWGKYKTIGKTTTLRISFQFHHVQMDGDEACQFLDEIQNQINDLNT